MEFGDNVFDGIEVIIMRISLRWLAACLILIGLYLSACVPKEYQQALEHATLYESQRELEKAYEHYKQALELRPGDKKTQAKLRELGKLISENITQKGIRAFDNKKYKTAAEYLAKALSYDTENKLAKEYQEKTILQINAINQMYERANGLAAKNKWIEAIDVLNKIAASYDDDPNLSSQINKWREDGYAHYMNAGLEARQEGEYSQSLRLFDSANFLKSDSESQRELELAKKYVKADIYYIKAKQNAEQDEVLEAMAELISAREIVADHLKVNQLIGQLLPAWSPEIFNAGKMHLDAEQPDKAFEAFATLYKLNPQYPEAQAYYEKTKATYLKNNYLRLVDANNAARLPSITRYSQNILEVDPSYLDTKEIMTRALLKGFNVFYQKGLHYMQNGNYGKAILCFRSAEQYLTETMLTQSLIHKAWENIRETSTLKVAFWDFFQQIGDPRMSVYATAKLKDLLKTRVETNAFKNIALNFERIKQTQMAYRSGFVEDIDWGTIQVRGYNSVISGYIKLLKVEKSLGSEWKTRKRKVRRIIENEQYARLVIRRAELNTALKGKTRLMVDNEKYVILVNEHEALKAELDSAKLSSRDEKKIRKNLASIEKKLAKMKPKREMTKVEIRAELKNIDQTLPQIPPKIEADVEEETSYQITKHTMTAHIQVELQIATPDGGHVWPLKQYEDIFQVIDHVIPPNANSDDPQERMGDPLILPSDSEFKKQAIDNVIQNKVYPDLIDKFENYGMRFYNRAAQLSKPEIKPDPASMAFLDAIEEYFKFLACYEDKGYDDKLPEEVQQYLDRYVSNLCLVRKPVCQPD
jgi:tetratricopeptide (TPR) repeat protein